MKTLISHLNKVLAIALTFALLGLCSVEMNAQKIDKNTARKEARANRGAAGFETINFSKSSLQSILNNASAIKFYNGIQNGARDEAVLMLIGLDANGNEIGDLFVQSGESAPTTDISRPVKDLQVANAESNRKIQAFSTTFSASDILEMLNAAGVTGIEFSPSKKADASGTEVLTLTATPTGGAETQQMQSLRSPCPPECFN